MSNATATVNKSDLAGKTVADLVKIDRTKLDGETLAALNAVMAEKLMKCFNGGVIADPVSGRVTLCGREIGTVKGQIAKAYLPKQWKIAKGENTLTTKQMEDGEATLYESVVATSRFGMAAFDGNGVHIAGQQGKGIDALAKAAAIVNSKTA